MTGPTIPEAFSSEQQFRLQVQDRFAQPVLLPTYTVSTLPAAATWVQCLIYVSNGTSNKRVAVSDGTNWRFPDGNVVS